ncbi:hypothetical protein HQN89_26930 [Paenibacillus frigoriresistens]|uniref:hypothetical protein n=1 Tax=Paenibacillus alginolyticus TaxID=59839 RepID=UPI001567C306|nr:hypothetical protein [Paenibacillus frigoriresistens]NRF94545.1 hypothetical protein [Paenibacillus frigoriresistens]
MKSIGFIDYYLDEWHAEQYPERIEKATDGEMKVRYAFGIIDKENGLTNAQWCEKHGIELLSSIEEVIERSDYLIVLSPDNPEYHEQLSDLSLRSGKPTYIDKTFAPDRKTALRLFELANQHQTPMYSTSALRYAAEYVEAERSGVKTICSLGPGRYDNYSIHQIEPIVSIMGSKPTKVMFIGTPSFPALQIAFADGRFASIHHFGVDCSFSMTVGYGAGYSKTLKLESDFFASFIRNMTEFFRTGKPPVNSAETVAIITIIEFGLKSAETPFQWVALPTE